MAVATSDASAAPAGTDVPEAGQLVRVRGQQWVVSQVRASRQPADPLAEVVLPGRTLVELSSVADDDLGAGLSVVWEVEPGRQVLPVSELPAVEPERLPSAACWYAEALPQSRYAVISSSSSTSASSWSSPHPPGDTLRIIKTRSEADDL